MSDDYDSPWKEALDIFFESFLALLFPTVLAQIDWSRGSERLDKEFQQIVSEAELGRRYVDKLVKVWSLEGVECWVLIHVEVQTTHDANFSQRMFVYRYRIFDRYNKPVASLAVLADDVAEWRPDEFRQSLFGCESVLRFPTTKLHDFINREAELEASRNPFAKIVLAHLKTQQTKDDPSLRHDYKLRIVRSLFESGFNANDVRALFRLIDWMMRLPTALDKVFWDGIAKIQEEKHMPFISTPERVGRCAGICIGIKTVLQMKFGEEGLKLMPKFEKMYEEDQLRAVLEAIVTSNTLEDIHWAEPS